MTDTTKETVDLINACYKQHREFEARWEAEDRMGEAERMYYLAVRCMNSAIVSLRSAAERLRNVNEPVIARFCEEKAASLDPMKPERPEFVLATELLKEAP